MAVYEMYQYKNRGEALALTALSAVGATDTVKVMGCKSFTWQYVVASINTSVTVRVEGSLDNSSWFNLETTDTTKTANGTYYINWNGRGEIAYTRFYFVAEVGGAAATITPTIYAA